MAIRLNASDPDFPARFRSLVAAQRGVLDDVDAVVETVLQAVEAEGDRALIRFTREFDRVDLTDSGLRFSESELAAAFGACDPIALEDLRVVAARIAAFHERQVPSGFDFRESEGVRLGQRWTPIEAVGLYVPGGRAAYPSSVLMNAVPARVAGVSRLAMMVPTPDGALSPLVLAAAQIAGVSEIYRVGGAQAIGAMAFGTESIEPVDKIAGPGNAYVAAAKRKVFGTVGIDAIAGPSEILVVADSANDPTWIAADLLSQAEHDPVAQAILITDSPDFATMVEQAVARLLEDLPKAEIAGASWENHGAVLTVGDLHSEAPPLVDALAPEHLELAVADPGELVSRVRHAGAIFLGRYSPEVIGDYVAGPNHVLPTSRSARFSSGLSVLDFMKRTSIIDCGPEGMRTLGPIAVRLAQAEGLDAHALSAAVRLDSLAGHGRPDHSG